MFARAALRDLFRARPFSHVRSITTLQTNTVYLNKDIPLERGGVLSGAGMMVKYSSWALEDKSRPLILLLPSMSNSPFFIDGVEANTSGEIAHQGWWSFIVGQGPKFGIDLEKFRILCPSPIGSPFGSTSPLTTHPETMLPYGPSFPQITPRDQAVVHMALLEHLGICSEHQAFMNDEPSSRKNPGTSGAEPPVHAVLGGSMGGMQALQFASLFPNAWKRCAAVATTPHTSPNAVAIRSVQRQAIRLDPAFADGNYVFSSITAPPKAHSERLPQHWGHLVNTRAVSAGMRVARMFGMICYRSRTEFDDRFSWDADDEGQFEVQAYLEHHAQRFVRGGYDPNCYLLLSKSMDLMALKPDLLVNANFGHTKELMLLPYTSDVLMPPSECEWVVHHLGNFPEKIRLHYEPLETTLGHDAFLVNKPREVSQLSQRLGAFLRPNVDGIDSVRNCVSALHE